MDGLTSLVGIGSAAAFIVAGIRARISKTKKKRKRDEKESTRKRPRTAKRVEITPEQRVALDKIAEEKRVELAKEAQADMELSEDTLITYDGIEMSLECVEAQGLEILMRLRVWSQDDKLYPVNADPVLPSSHTRTPGLRKTPIFCIYRLMKPVRQGMDGHVVFGFDGLCLGKIGCPDNIDWFKIPDGIKFLAIPDVIINALTTTDLYASLAPRASIVFCSVAKAAEDDTQEM